MADLKKLYELAEEMGNDGLLFRAYVDEFAQHIEKCRLLYQNDRDYLDTYDYGMAESLFDFIRGMLWGIRSCQRISLERVDGCVDELLAAFDF